jgi:creatinine amidohydrolase
MKVFADMNRQQIGSAASSSLVVVPLGATEQHGPHLPTGTDLFVVEALALEAAKIASEQIPVIVTPSLPFGSSDHHFVFGGTISLGTETYYRVLKDIVESLVTDGFKRIFLLNGHGGNHELMQLAARDVALKHPVRVGAGSYWSIAWDALIQADAHRGRRLPGHAGDFETSVILSLRPELVSDSRPKRDQTEDSDPRGFQSAWRTEQHGFWREIDGYTDSPSKATAENGAKFRALAARAVADALVAFYGD